MKTVVRHLAAAAAMLVPAVVLAHTGAGGAVALLGSALLLRMV